MMSARFLTVVLERAFNMRDGFGRGVCVIRKNTLIVNLPGSVKAVSESMDFLMGNIEHGLDILLQYDSECGRCTRCGLE